MLNLSFEIAGRVMWRHGYSMPCRSLAHPSMQAEALGTSV
jgi:hypothetical protein